MAGGSPEAHKAAKETVQVHDEIRSTEEHQHGRNRGMGSRETPGGLLGGGRRFRWKERKGSQDCGNRTSKGTEQEWKIEGMGRDRGTLWKDLTHRRHSVDFLKRVEG